jgi:hypothetical protein
VIAKKGIFGPIEFEARKLRGFEGSSARPGSHGMKRLRRARRRRGR